jgi:hypothetical protein
LSASLAKDREGEHVVMQVKALKGYLKGVQGVQHAGAPSIFLKDVY